MSSGKASTLTSFLPRSASGSAALKSSSFLATRVRSSGQTAPSAIHWRSLAISPSLRGRPFGGITSESSAGSETSSIISDSSGLPFTSEAPPSPPAKKWAALSKRRFAFASDSLWQLTQLNSRIGWTSRTKSIFASSPESAMPTRRTVEPRRRDLGLMIVGGFRHWSVVLR